MGTKRYYLLVISVQRIVIRKFGARVIWENLCERNNYVDAYISWRHVCPSSFSRRHTRAYTGNGRTHKLNNYCLPVRYFQRRTCEDGRDGAGRTVHTWTDARGLRVASGTVPRLLLLLPVAARSSRCRRSRSRLKNNRRSRSGRAGQCMRARWGEISRDRHGTTVQRRYIILLYSYVGGVIGITFRGG